ncbi:MAG TPA: calcium-binding protein [Actinomycetota bacterium]|nr:calcium-binding protein [Actinomycetota bacterium]
MGIRRTGIALWAAVLLVLGAMGVSPAGASSPRCFGAHATIVGTQGNDDLRGTAGPDVIVALAGHDTIRSGPGNDRVCSGAGNDLVVAGRGADRVGAGPGHEDEVFGGPGDDYLKGGPGFIDRLDGGPGDDHLDGGRGEADHAIYEGTSNDIVANLSTGVITGVGRDTVASIEAVHGGTGDDLLIGNADPNDLAGEDGDDRIFGRGGDDFFLAGLDGHDRILGEGGEDSLLGGDGGDVLKGGPGDFDFVQPGFGKDTASGGSGYDLLVYTFTTFPEVAPGVTVDLAAGTAIGQGSDSVPGFEEVWGSDGDDDVLFGTGAFNELIGFGGDDELYGRGGDDSLVPGRGDDIIDGGPDVPGTFDIADFGFISVFEEPHASVTVDLQAGVATGQGDDLLTAVEGVVGTPHDDSVFGDAGSNLLVGLDGSDLMKGRAGDDLLDGDLILFEGIHLPGTDTLDGGPDTDLCVGGEITVSCETTETSARSQAAPLDISPLRGSHTRAEMASQMLRTMEGETR